MLLQATGQLPGAVAQGGVGVGFVLGKGTGQGLGIHRLLNRFKAGVRVLMLQNLCPAANQIAVGVIAARVFLVLIRLMGVENDLLLPAGQNRRAGFRGQAAGKHLVPRIAVIRMHMGRFLGLTAGQFSRYRIAAFSMLMIFFTDQRRRLRIAVIRMHMGRFRGLRTDQFSTLHGVAFVRMGMGFRLYAAGVRVLVRFHLRKRTQEMIVRVIARRIVMVDHGIRLDRTVQTPFLPGGHLGIAGIRMCVLRNLALLFQCDGWQNESVGRAEHNHCRQTGHDLIPALFSPVRAGISLSIPQDPFIHPATSSILFQFSESAKGENPEYNFSNNLFLRHTANLRMPGIHRGRTVVAHAEVPVVRHLVGQLQIAVAKGFFLQVGLVQQLAVHIDVSFLIDIHPLARTGNAALHQNLVPQIKRHQIALVKLRAFEGDHNVALIQRRRHGRSVNLKNRHPDRRHQHGDRRHNDQRIQGAAQNRAETGLILYPLQLRGKLISGGVVHRFLHHRFHFVPVRSSAERRTFSRYCCAALSAASNTAFSRIAASAMEPAFS